MGLVSTELEMALGHSGGNALFAEENYLIISIVGRKIKLRESI